MSVAAIDTAVTALDVSAYALPTDGPAGKEADGTLEWSSTTCVVVEARGGGAVGLGYTYGPAAVGTFVQDELCAVVRGADALTPARTWTRMQEQVRNAGRDGVGAM